jgi:mono/diheme cytochrome c family protein
MSRFAVSVLAFALVTVAAAARAEGSAAALFQKRCATCHGMDGKGQTKMGERMGIKDLAASSGSAADLEKIIADGRGKMPAFKGRISDDEIKSVTAFVKAGLK